MSEYQPGRIYSGVVLGKRRLLMRRDPDLDDYVWDSGDNAWGDSRVTDVRGPLVVLDFPDLSYVPAALREVAQPNSLVAVIADQIEAQTTPPLQVGWHECHLDDALPRVLWWDGERFLHAPHGSWVDKWRSVAYLGKGTCA